MIQVFSQLLSAALGSVGFGLIFNLNRRYLPAAGVGGLLAWLAYLLAANTL
ncbi:threonine/serine exporter, partial [Xanthomonas citri pv. citri]|nr:threonine/serine exporter [Xanthomonas citri pv. citri]